MCDIYAANCKVCGKEIPMHLSDYDTDRKEVEVFCGEHIPGENVVIWTLLEDEYYEDVPCVQKTLIQRAPEKFGVRSLTENARKNQGGNHPNFGSRMHMQVVK